MTRDRFHHFPNSPFRPGPTRADKDQVQAEQAPAMMSLTEHRDLFLDRAVRTDMAQIEAGLGLAGKTHGFPCLSGQLVQLPVGLDVGEKVRRNLTVLDALKI